MVTKEQAKAQGLVWSIHDNAYVTLDYWEWVNGRGHAIHNAGLGRSPEDRAADSQEHAKSPKD